MRKHKPNFSPQTRDHRRAEAAGRAASGGGRELGPEDRERWGPRAPLDREGRLGEAGGKGGNEGEPLAQRGEPLWLTLFQPCSAGDRGTERLSVLPRATQLVRRADCRQNAGCESQTLALSSKGHLPPLQG